MHMYVPTACVYTKSDVQQLKKLGVFNPGKGRLSGQMFVFQCLRAGPWCRYTWLWVTLEWRLQGGRILPQSQSSSNCQGGPTMPSLPSVGEGQWGSAGPADELWEARGG